MRRIFFSGVSMCLSVLLSGAALADPTPAAVRQLMTKDLVGTAGKEVLMSTVTYPPGGASAPHRHDAQVFVYVLEGELNMQVQGGPKSRSNRGTHSMKAQATCMRCPPMPVRRRRPNSWCSSSRIRARQRRARPPLKSPLRAAQ